MKELIDRQEVIRHIGDCLDKNGYVDTTKFAKCMRQIFNMPYESEESIRADERRKFVEWISQYLGEGNTNNVLYTYRQSPVGFIWQTTKSVDEIIAEYEKEKKNDEL